MKVIAIVNSQNVGDFNTAKALVEGIKFDTQYYIDYKQGHEQAFWEYQGKIKEFGQENTITLVVGFDRTDFLDKLKNEKNKSYTVFITHQGVEGISNLPIDHLVMPESGVGLNVQKILKDKFNCTFPFAMPSKVFTSEELKNLYDNFNWLGKTSPNLSNKYTFIILGGDAPDSSKTIQCFTKESVGSLFNYIKTTNIPLPIILQNGPRTGKHNPENTNEIICDHTWGKDDYITKYFMSLCEKNNIDCSLYPFYFKENKEVVSYYKPLLHCIISSKGIVFVPGDSVSILAELTALLPAKQIIVYKTSSTNESHEKIIEAALEKGYVLGYLVDGQMRYTAKEKLRETPRGNEDVSLVAEDIIKGYNNSRGKQEQNINI